MREKVRKYIKWRLTQVNVDIVKVDEWITQANPGREWVSKWVRERLMKKVRKQYKLKG